MGSQLTLLMAVDLESMAARLAVPYSRFVSTTNALSIAENSPKRCRYHGNDASYFKI